VGHRALHAVPTGDGYDCYRTRWDGLAVFEGSFPERPESRRPVAEVLDPIGVLRALAPGDEALFVHGEDAAYLVRSLDVPLASAGDTRTDPGRALVPVPDPETARRLDDDIATAKGILGDAVDAGFCTRRVAEEYLRAFVAHHPDAEAVVWGPSVARDAGPGRPPP
jgi:hypothetical protein